MTPPEKYWGAQTQKPENNPSQQGLIFTTLVMSILYSQESSASSFMKSEIT